MTTTTDTGVPDTREELIRKTVDFASRLQERIERGTVDTAIAAAQCRALWYVTSGLLDDETSGLLSLQGSSVGPGPIKRFFAGDNKVLLLAYLPDSPGWVLQSVSPADGSRTLLKRSTADIGDREQEIATLTAGLLARGLMAL